ncbi:peptidase inhibitor family I36 protein [Chitinophaga filiformis]|uniref:Peptidase inhibitor family I36 protein n=1 Tax=Chitinophaga filiformis TaxID=104663 RepID=A0ABY4I1A7_CHIFI|nr:peptidase inhibitor family I36 protein [Chitinophaga filiformis]UPK68506.1 peptidase inhibitor family I36 protein [Chitinophaga filiformis]
MRPLKLPMKWPGRRMPVLLALSLFLTCCISVHAAANDPSNQAVFYTDINYGGTAVALSAGTYTRAQMIGSGLPDDAVSSFTIPAGYQVTFFWDDNFTGASLTKTASASFIGLDWNDKVTSLIVSRIPPGEQAVFYTDINYGGTAVALSAGTYTRAQMIANGLPDDAITSYMIPAGYQVTFFWDDNFTGASLTKTASESWIGTDWNDKVTSLIITKVAPEEQAVFYTDASYLGKAVPLSPGNYTRAQMIAYGLPDDAVSSFTVPAGYQVTVYWDDNFSGASLTRTASEPWIGPDWNDKVTSLIIAKINPSSWQANWVWTSAAGPANTWLALRKKVTLSAKPSRALTKIAVENKYWLYVNNQLVVKDGGLDVRPDLLNTYYDEVDLAPYLTPGENTIAVLVWHKGGNNSYSQRVTNNGGFLFESSLSGSTPSSIVSDASWKAKVHPSFGATTQLILDNSDYKWIAWPVSYNAQAEPGAWTTAAYDDSSWPSAVQKGIAGAAPWNQLMPRTIPMWKEYDLGAYTNAASFPATISSNRIITARVGTNIQLRPYLKVNAPAGVKIRIEVNRFYWQEYITKAGEQEFECFAWQNSSGDTVSYQFSNVTGPVQVLILRYRETSYNTTVPGTFTSNDGRLNSLWNKSKATSRVCMRDIFYDCPNRERGQWWGDVSQQILYSFYLYDTASNLLARKGYRELLRSQKSDGSLYTTGPGTAFHLPDQNLAAIAMLARYYTYTGDRALLEELYPSIKKFAAYCVNSSNSDGMLVWQDGPWNWIDWGDNKDATPAGAANTVYNGIYVSFLESAASIANALGYVTDKLYYEQLLNRVRSNFNNYFWNSNANAYVYHRTADGVQSQIIDDRSNAWAFLAGVANDAQKAAILNVLKTKYNASPYQEMYIEQAMVQLDPKAGIKRMKDRYAGMIDSWSSTLWEEFPASNSNNHAWAAGPLYVMSAYVLGIRPSLPGYEEYAFLPQPADLTNISGVIPTVKGNISASLTTGSAGLTQAITAPPGTTGIVGIPKSAITCGLKEIRVNGTVIWRNGSTVTTIPGVTFNGEDAQYVKFRVSSGAWTFEAGCTLSAPATGSSLVVAPNPFTSDITVKAEGIKEPYVIVKVFNSNGGLVLPAKRVQNGTSLSLSHLPAGVYIINTTAGKKTYSNKVIKY